MLKVTASELHPGMTLAQSIPNPQQPEYILLKSGFELDQDNINRLRSLGVALAWVKYPNLDFLDSKIDIELINKNKELYCSMKEQFAQSQDINLGKLDYKAYMAQTQGLFQHLMSRKDATADFISDLQGNGDDIFRHGTTCASLSMLIGMKLESYLIKERSRLPGHLATDLSPLGLGCLLHDIGKLRFSDELRKFRLTAHDRGSEEWQGHTEAGFEMIHGGLDSSAGQVVLNHHQHYDGSGFPNRKCLPGDKEPSIPLAGPGIHIFCRIAAVVNRFDGFRYLPDGTMAPLIVALKRMKNPGYVKWFDPVVYEAFIQTVPAFTLGEKVMLNDGQTCVVIEQNMAAPCKPIVRPINVDMAIGRQTAQEEEGKGQACEPKDINLLKRTDMHIAKVGDFDVAPYLH